MSDVSDVRCPTCGSEPDDVDCHREGCPRIDTCGQYGPPWVPEGEWHPESDFTTCPPGSPNLQWLHEVNAHMATHSFAPDSGSNEPST